VGHYTYISISACDCRLSQVMNEGRSARHKWTHGWGIEKALLGIRPRVVWDNNTTLRPNTSHAHSPTHDDHMHASAPT
jgi:hypothetical protein